MSRYCYLSILLAVVIPTLTIFGTEGSTAEENTDQDISIQLPVSVLYEYTVTKGIVDFKLQCSGSVPIEEAGLPEHVHFDCDGRDYKISQTECILLNLTTDGQGNIYSEVDREYIPVEFTADRFVAEKDDPCFEKKIEVREDGSGQVCTFTKKKKGYGPGHDCYNEENNKISPFLEYHLSPTRLSKSRNPLESLT